MYENQISWSSLKETFPHFMEKIMVFISDLGLDISDLQIDHIAIRVKDPSNVELLKKELNALSINNSPISNEIVNGREIMIFKLLHPLVYENYQIPCIELPYPSSSHHYKVDGWEHIEVVIPSDANTTEIIEEEFMKKYPGFDKNNPIIDELKVSMPVVEHQPANPTLAIQRELGLAVKFHPRTIEEIVTSRVGD